MGSCLSSDGGGGRINSSAASSPLSQGSRKGKKGRRRRPFEEQHMLHKIPGRMFANGTSGVASLFTQQGKKGTNQDAMIVWENFGSRTDTIFCGVFDGHGPYGHMVARRVRDSLPLKLSSHWEVNIGNDDLSRENRTNMVGSPNAEETASLCADDELSDSIHLEQETHPEIFSILKESFLKAFKVMDKELKLHPSIDCFCSGTTAVTLVKQGNDLVIGNIGDSRAVLGTRDQNDCLTAVQLTVDLKPNLPKEEARIKQHNGRVFSLRDEPEVARVWLPHNDSPGLAMARAFGDFCLKDYGLISVPEVSYRRLTEKDEFIVLATDGVWDVLSNTEVVDIVAAAPRSSAARSLVQSAVRAWRYKYPTSKIDDCAVVCLFLDNNSGDSIGSCSSSTLTKEKLESGSSSTKKKSSPSLMTTWDPLGIREEGKGKGKVKGKEEGKGGELSGSESCPQSPSDSQAGSGVEGDEWSALEGVSRTNTLLTLPRFNDPVEKKSARSNSTKKVA